MMAMPRVVGIVMAGGRGDRLQPLTRARSKAAVPFGARHRIIDYVLSNFVNSGIYALYVLVQYKSQSLIEHVSGTWRIGGRLPETFVTVVPPQMRGGESWYRGTADAVFQNLNLIRDFGPELVAVFGADHVYRMDLRHMIQFHLASRADVTVAARCRSPRPRSSAS
jgi:glucose-1-phosphate adenylyltransferase